MLMSLKPGDSLVAQLVKNLPATQETPVWFPVRKIRWRRDRLPTPVFLGFPGGSNGKESACNARDLGLIHGLGRSFGEGNGLHTSVFWPGEFRGLYDCMGSQRVGHNWATFTFTEAWDFWQSWYWYEMIKVKTLYLKIWTGSIIIIVWCIFP